MLALVLAAILIYQLSRRIPHCEADSILISKEAGQLVVSHGQWKVQNSLFQATGNYSGMISYYSPQQQLQRREPVDVSFELRHSFSGAALRSETLPFPTISPTAPHHRILSAISPPDWRPAMSITAGFIVCRMCVM